MVEEVCEHGMRSLAQLTERDSQFFAQLVGHRVRLRIRRDAVKCLHNAGFHFGSSLVGECDRQDLPVVLVQPFLIMQCQAEIFTHEREGLSAAGASFINHEVLQDD